MLPDIDTEVPNAADALLDPVNVVEEMVQEQLNQVLRADVAVGRAQKPTFPPLLAFGIPTTAASPLMATEVPIRSFAAPIPQLVSCHDEPLPWAKATPPELQAGLDEAFHLEGAPAMMVAVFVPVDAHGAPCTSGEMSTE